MLQRSLIALLRVTASLGKTEEFHPHEVGSILVIELSRFGDVIVMLPFLNALQRTFHDATIRVLVDQRHVSLLRALRSGVEFKGFQNPGSAPGLARVLRFVRDARVDLAVSVSTPRRNALATLASKSRFKIGYLSYVDSLSPFLMNTSVEAYGFPPPAVARYTKENIYQRPVKILEALRVEFEASDQLIEFDGETYSIGRERLYAAGAIPEEPYVLLHPFAGWRFREWGIDRFISLGNMISRQLRYSVVLVCEKDQKSRVPIELLHDSSIRLFSPSELLDVAIVMKGSSLVVGNDSGPLHLAAALGRSAVGLFGPAPPSLTAPVNSRGSNLYQRVECSPCDQRKCIRPESPCMGLHSVNEVFHAVTDALRSSNVRQSSAPNVQG